MKYWPRFRDLIAIKEPRQALELQFKYLIRMEPLSTIDMYVQCWKKFNNDYDIFEYAIDGFNRPEIPRIKREQIYSVIVDCINRDVSNIEYDESRRRLREYLLQQLRSELLPLEEDEQAKEIFNELRIQSSKYQPENVAIWLANDEQTHPLINMLAEADEPELRLLVMGALREHPIPANRAIMKKLLQDTDKEVRMAAQEVAAEVEKLKVTPPLQLAVNNIIEQP
jgi:hypothetical protein